MRTFVLGDIHGAYIALLQCLERCCFDYDNDSLIQLGDIVDGYPQSYECVEELLKIKNLISIKGNHDEWLNEFIINDFHPQYWSFGGKGTLISYLTHSGKKDGYVTSRRGFKTSLNACDFPQMHQQFFANQKLFYVDENSRCFVHAGFDSSCSFYEQKQSEYYDNRSLWHNAFFSVTHNGLKNNEASLISQFSRIFIGHTPTTNYGSDKPLTVLNITNVDTGAGHNGRLTIMDVDTGKFWQSDPVQELYNQNFR